MKARTPFINADIVAGTLCVIEDFLIISNQNMLSIFPLLVPYDSKEENKKKILFFPFTQRDERS